MTNVDLWSLTQPKGIMRTMAAILTCVSFVLVATVGQVSSPYLAWCMFTWGFCFFVTLLILVLEFTTVSAKLPFAWDDFTAAFAMLASLMCLATSIIYPTFLGNKNSPRQVGASVASWVCFGMYSGEVVYTRLCPSGQSSGFLSTLPGIMKMVETFFVCLIFTSLEKGQYAHSPELQWCVSVYSLCFIFSIIIILLTTARLTSSLPFCFDKLVTIYNILAAVMYTTAMVIWPLYSFSRPCDQLCTWDKLVVVTFLTILNFIVYTLDSVYSIYLVFFVNTQ